MNTSVAVFCLYYIEKPEENQQWGLKFIVKVRKNITIPSWLHYEVEHAGINISRVLQEALMNVLNVQRNF